MFDYMAHQRENFPYLDHWDQVFWAIVNEIVDRNDPIIPTKPWE